EDAIEIVGEAHLDADLPRGLRRQTIDGVFAELRVVAALRVLALVDLHVDAGLMVAERVEFLGAADRDGGAAVDDGREHASHVTLTETTRGRDAQAEG